MLAQDRSARWNAGAAGSGPADHIYLARVLTAADFGFFSLVGTILFLARKFLDLGLSNVCWRADIAPTPGASVRFWKA